MKQRITTSNVILVLLSFFLSFVSYDTLAQQTAEVTRSGDIWTANINGNEVYSGNRMFDAVNAACNNMGEGTVNIRNSGESGPGGSNIYAIRPQNDQILDFHGNTINCNGNDLIVAIRADRVRNVTVRNVNVIGGPRYGFWFTGCSDVTFSNITMDLSASHNIPGLGIRVSGRDHPASNLNINGTIDISSTGHAIEVYTVDYIQMETVTVSSEHGCGVLLNDSWEVSIDSIFAYDCNWGGSYAGLRLANRNRRTRVGYLYARGCGRGFYSVSDSHDCIIEEVDIADNSTSGASVSNTSHNIYINSGTIINSNTNVDIWNDAREVCIRVNGGMYGDDCSDLCTPTAITAYHRVNQGEWEESNSAEIEMGSTVEFGPQPTTGGSWNWDGPENFSADTRSITISDIQSNQVGTYTATYTNDCGAESSQDFMIIDVTPDCNGTPGGNAYEDQCGRCVEGNTDVMPCATDLEEGYYRISPVHTGYCLENNDPITQEECIESTEQYWQVTRHGDEYRIQSLASGEYMSGGTVVQEENTAMSADPENLLFSDAGDGNYYISPVADQTLVFDVFAISQTAGERLILWENTGAANQHFTFTPVDLTEDCHGDLGGAAEIDSCGNCAGGNTGVEPITDPEECTITSIEDRKKRELTAYPNPTQGNVSLTESTPWTVVSTFGEQLASGEGKIISLDNYPSGVYIILTAQGTVRVVKK